MGLDLHKMTGLDAPYSFDTPMCSFVCGSGCESTCWKVARLTQDDMRDMGDYTGFVQKYRLLNFAEICLCGAVTRVDRPGLSLVNTSTNRLIQRMLSCPPY